MNDLIDLALKVFDNEYDGKNPDTASDWYDFFSDLLTAITKDDTESQWGLEQAVKDISN